MRTGDRIKKGTSSELSKKDAIERVAVALDQIQYGEVIIKIQAGKPVFVDKYERERVG